MAVRLRLTRGKLRSMGCVRSFAPLFGNRNDLSEMPTLAQQTCDVQAHVRIFIGNDDEIAFFRRLGLRPRRKRWSLAKHRSMEGHTGFASGPPLCLLAEES